MIIILLISFLLAFLALLFYPKKSSWLGYIAAFGTLGLFVYSLSFVPVLLERGGWLEQYSWVPSLGIDLNFLLDGLSLFFLLLITLFGFFILTYASSYMQGKRQTNRFFFYLILFMSAMLGLVLSDHILLMYIFWELTSVSSYFLISYENQKEEARSAGLQALLVTNFGGLALLAGLILLGNAVGSYHFSEIIKHNIADHPHYTAILALVFLGCFTKSAQFPFHFWLPNAMAAPTPVSAFLHSATMVKAGIFSASEIKPHAIRF